MSYFELNAELTRSRQLVMRRPRPYLASPGPYRKPTPTGMSRHLKRQRRSRSFDAISFRVPGIVAPIRQPSSMTCWATVATMMLNWKRNVSEGIASAVGGVAQEWADKFTANQGLSAADKPRFLAAAGFQSEPPMNFTIEGWLGLLRNFGPLWVTTDEQPGAGFAIHARIMVGISGDGTPDGTQVQIVDPATGSEYTESFVRFLRKFEEEARDSSRNSPLRVQVVHWPANAQAQAQSFARARTLSTASSPLRAHAFGAIDYRVPGIVPEIQQPTSMLCWATVTTMLVSWKENQSMPIRDVIERYGQPYLGYVDNNRPLPANENTAFFNRVGMVLEAPQSFSIEGWRRLLQNYGPLIVWVHPPANPQNLMHLMVLIGMSGDGSPAGTRFHLVDPGSGREVSYDTDGFIRRYEEVLGPFPPGSEGLIWQVIHWPAGAQSMSFGRPQVRRRRTSQSFQSLMAWGARVSSEFRTRVREIAADLGCDVDFLMAAMAFETGGTFSPSVRNSSSGATGLIQFMPRTAEGLGTTTDALSRMTAVQQLDYVARYFAPYRNRLSTLEDVYMAILWPRAVGQPNDHVLFSRPSRAYEQNRGLDTDRDGHITKAEASSFVRRRLEQGRTAENAG